MQYLTRTFIRTVATVSEVTNDENGNPIIVAVGQLVFVGDVDNAKATKLAKKEYPNKTTVIVTKLERLEELRGMPVNDFLCSSVLMDDPRTPHTNPLDIPATTEV